MKEDEVNTTGGKVKRQPIPGMLFESQPPVGSKKEAELLKAREAIDKELQKVRDARRKAEFAKTPEGKKWQKQWEEEQAQKKRAEVERAKVWQQLLLKARQKWAFRRLADEYLGKHKPDEKSEEFQKILQSIVELYNLVQSHYYIPTR